MNARKTLILLAVSAAAVILLKKLGEKSQSEPDVVNVVAETLHKHEGEDNPIVHAFEEALEHQTKHEG